MKKILILIIAIIMILSLVCCKKSDKKGNTPSGSDAVQSSDAAHKSSGKRATDDAKGYKIGEGPVDANNDDDLPEGDSKGESESEIRDTDGD